MSEKPKKKTRRLNYKKMLVFLLSAYFITLLFFKILDTPITNIYVRDNVVLSDQVIIDLAKVGNYPSTFKTLNSSVENRLKTSIYIKSAHVYKKNFTELYIEVIENKPIFYNLNLKQTVLQDGKTVPQKHQVPTLINYVPDLIYAEFISKMSLLKEDVLIRVSEIEYKPNDVDDSRFLLAMTDGNYVYLTLNKFNLIDDYVSIVKNFGEKKGILYLDSGEYFDIIER